ncbi:MAG TPA: cytidine/deoxycytidylate deaminase family protein [bacterium]|nr:cytidine/deoxycytidylate deaminase family protein [bacterium]
MEKDKQYKRPSWDEYFMSIVDIVGTRGTCDRGRAGTIIVKDKRILTTGYVGAPENCASCDEIGHELNTVIHEDGEKTQHCMRTTHSEQNAICQAARMGISIHGSTLYTRMTPCYACAKMIINCGIKRVVCKNDYHAGDRSKEIFKEAGVKYELLNDEVVKYDNM